MSKIQRILVIGAGVAGPAVCYWLKKFGFSPTLIEKNSSPRKSGYAIDIRGIATSLVKKMGIYEEIYAKRTQIQNGCYVNAQGNILHQEEGAKFGFRKEDEIELVRGELVEILMQLIKGIPCYYDRNVEQIEQQKDGLKVIFNGGLTEQYDLVIGADGLHSSTRRMVFSKEEYNLVSLGSYISVCSIPNYLNLNKSEFLFELDQKLIHLSNDRTPTMAHAGFMFRSNHQLNDIRDEQEQKEFLRTTFRDLGWESNKILELMEQSNDFYFDAIMQVKMKSWTKGRVALLGDSGYCASPLSGQGTSLALVGAYILAGELQAARDNHANAFDKYNQLLRPYVQMNQDFGVWVSNTFLLPDEVSKEAVEERAAKAMAELHNAAHAMVLPEYKTTS
ncbi:tetracycline destructase [Fluoribacter dumoffii]|nr:tetracycline destructase [Fluoribacter dumoffii]MCW8496923.1 tetracycline destructase [Fluoribacter dumoffii]